MEPCSTAGIYAVAFCRSGLRRFQGDAPWRPRREPQPTHSGPVDIRSPAYQVGPEPFLWTASPVVLDWRADGFTGATPEAVSALYQCQLIPQQCGQFRLSWGAGQAG